MNQLLRNLIVSLPLINGGFDTAILVGMAPYYAYDSSGKVSERQLGIKYRLLLDHNKYIPITCKVECLTPCISPEELETNGSVHVCPKHFAGRFYQMNNNSEIMFTSTAIEMEVVK